MVYLCYTSLDQKPIAAKCESVKELLLPLTSALNGAKLRFYGRIDPIYLPEFSDHSMLLAHLVNDLLPICNRCRAYEFRLNFLSGESAPALISSILKMGPVRNCNNVVFELFAAARRTTRTTPLPVETITEWFIQGADEGKAKKSLDIRMRNISNGAEVEARLKEAKAGLSLKIYISLY